MALMISAYCACYPERKQADGEMSHKMVFLCVLLCLEEVEQRGHIAGTSESMYLIVIHNNSLYPDIPS